MSPSNKEFPFETLGSQLRRLRERSQESLAETSGAVEIDPEMLGLIETGAERPGEDILLLLISHFGTKEDLASKLWELAGYSQQDMPIRNSTNSQAKTQPGIIVLPGDARIVYTDMVHVMVNNYGVVMNFMQTAGSSNQPLAVARVGMSREHAQSVLDILQKTLALHNPKTLPSETQHPKEKRD